MKIGHMTHLVTIQEPVEVQSTVSGEPVQIWTDLGTGVWASINHLRGREYWAAAQINAEIDTQIVIHYATGISHKCRIVDESSNEYQIHAIIPDERRYQLTCMCGLRAT